MQTLTTQQIAEITGAQPASAQAVEINALCSLEDARAGGICYVTSVDKPELLENLQASALLVPAAAKDKQLPFKGQLLYAQNPEWAFVLLMKYVDNQKQKYTPGIHPTAVISQKATLGANVSVGAYSVIEDGAVIGDNCVIFPQCYIGKDVQMGKNCLIYPQVVIREECVLKDGVILQAGARIGSDGFGFTFHDGRHQKIPQIGNVVIGSDAEIQSNACIDRAKISSTIIGDNTKIDNLVQVGHNVTVGQSCIFCSQVGIAGTTQIGNGVVLAGQVGLAGHMKVGDRVQVGAQSGAMGNLESGKTYLGTPAVFQRDFFKQMAIMQKLPAMYKEFQNFKKEAEEMKKLSLFGRIKKILGF